MANTIEDEKEISARFTQLKTATESGYYAPVIDTRIIEKDNEHDVFEIDLDLPDGDSNGVYRLTVPDYWESGRTLVDFLSNVNVSHDKIKELEDKRSLPIKRIDNSWQVDEDRLSNGDYLEDSAYTQK